MAEYIEREATINLLKSLGNRAYRRKEGTIEDAVKMLLHRAYTPAADVVEVKRGRWEWREEWETHHETRSCDLISCGWYCSECGIELGDYLTKGTGQKVILDDDFCKPTLARCPNCGADMRGDGDG